MVQNTPPENRPNRIPDNIEQLHDLLLKHDVDINNGHFRNREARAVKRELRIRKEQERDIQDTQSAIARHARRFINASLDFVAVVFVSIMVVGGIFISVGAFAIAEYFAVLEGFQVLHANLAPLYSAVVVTAYTVLLFISEIIEERSSVEPVAAFSLRAVWQKLVYTLGVGINWKPKFKTELSLARRARRSVFWIGATMVIFSLLGRIVPVLDGDVALKASVAVAVIGNVVMTVALLAGQHFQVHFIYQIFIRLTGGIDTSVDFFGGLSIEEEMEQARVRFLQNEVRKQVRNYQLPKPQVTLSDTQPYQLPTIPDED